MEKKKTTHLPFFGIGRMLPYLTHVRKMTVVMVVLALTGSVADIVIPLFQRYALNHFIALGTFDTVIPFILAYIGVLVGAAIVNYISTTLATTIEMRINQTLRQKGFEHLQTLSFSYYNQNSVGYIHARVISDTSRIGSLVSWTLMDSVWQVV